MDLKNLFTLLFTLLTFLSFSTHASGDLHSVKFESLKGKTVNFKEYKGKVLLVVNTASRCGYTPQFEGLQALYKKYKAQGFQVLGFPSNDFNQEDMNGKKLDSFCKMNYGVDFPMFTKSSVKGKNKNSVYKILTTDFDVRWNFEKLLVGKDGKFISRFTSGITPKDPKLKKSIELALSK